MCVLYYTLVKTMAYEANSTVAFLFIYSYVAYLATVWTHTRSPFEGLRRPLARKSYMPL